MKLCVIGGGGVRSMFLAKSIALKASSLKITELCFMDNDEVKLGIFGEMARHVVNKICPDLQFLLTTDAVEAVSDADYVITTIRVGGDLMRVRDERIALELGVIGQETTGAAGFSFAMRSIPALIEYCELIKKYSKENVKVFNFTNPAGIVSQALSDKGYDFTYGICDAPSGMLNSFAELLGAEASRVYGNIYGLNHLSFFNKITLDGKNVITDIINSPDAYNKTDMRYFSPELLKTKNYIPNEYLYYYFNTNLALENILSSQETRGELIERVNALMLEELKAIDIPNDFSSALSVFEKYYGIRENSYMSGETGIRRDKLWKFDPYSDDEGGYAGVALRFIDIVNSNKAREMILCIKNNGAIPFLKDEDIVEITCDVSEASVVPHSFSTDEMDSDAVELISRMKAYERNAAAAILNSDKNLAVQALALNPLVDSYSVAEKLIEAYISLNSDYSKGW